MLFKNSSAFGCTRKRERERAKACVWPCMLACSEYLCSCGVRDDGFVFDGFLVYAAFLSFWAGAAAAAGVVVGGVIFVAVADRISLKMGTKYVTVSK